MAFSTTLLKFRAVDSFLNSADALSKSAWLFLVTIGVYLVRPPEYNFFLFSLLVLSALFLAKMPLSLLLKSTKLIFPLGTLLFIFHSVIQPGNVIFKVPYLPLRMTDCGINIGLHYFFTLSSVVLVSLIFSRTTDVRDLMAGLIKIGFPYQIAFAVFLMFRFLPVVQQEIEIIQSAHAIRGRASRSNLGHRYYLWKRRMFTILVNGLRKAEQSSIATQSRAFGSVARHTELRDHHWTNQGLILLVFWISLIALFLILQAGETPCSAPMVLY